MYCDLIGQNMVCHDGAMARVLDENAWQWDGVNSKCAVIWLATK